MTPARRPLVALAPLVVTALAVGVLGFSWHGSRVPRVYDAMQMGVLDLGGGPAVAHAAHGAHEDAGPAVADLTGPAGRPPDVRARLEARQERFALGSGEQVDGYTLNGASPGPQLRARQGDLVEVRLVNRNVAGGVTLHWHGVDVPNAEDGVAGVTQDAVPPGREHVYRFVAAAAGTYWYHSHQASSEQVRHGLFGTLVVLPRDGLRQEHDVVAAVHSYGGRRTLNGRTGTTTLDAEPGRPVRVRVVNTDDGALRAWVSGAGFRVLAVDGTDVVGPEPVRGQAVLVTAGGRVDLELVRPADGAGVRLDVGGGTALVVGADVPPEPRPDETVDLLGYGTPVPLAFDPEAADRRFAYRVGRRPGFVAGRPGFWWTVNGALFPDVPMFLVTEGDVVRMTISNDSGDVHPMHLHGHHAVVVSRDGVPATGSPWVVDSLHVADGEEFEIAFVADNPGVWMAHCHNLEHAADGLVAHLGYAGVTGSFRVGEQVARGVVNRPD